jgi:hypothetical protein
MLMLKPKGLSAGKRSLFLLGTLLCAPWIATLAQTVEQPERPANNAVNNKDRAGHLADLVSLSPVAITQLLQREPGLLLEVKKAMVRKAYEEGRLLNPEDLTDEALFQLLHDDASVRSLATREIEARMYVRAKPNADELHQDLDWTIVEKSSFQARGAPEPAASGSQEAQFWATHEQIPLTLPAIRTTSQDQDEEDTPTELQKRQPIPAVQNFRVQPGLIAGDKGGGGDWFLPPDAGVSPRMSSSGLPGVLNASLSESADPSNALTSGTQRSSTQAAAAIASAQILNQTSAASGYGIGDSAYAVGPNPRMRVLAPSEKHEIEPDADRAGIRRQPNPYQDVPSLYDLYRQFSKHSSVPQRFGMEIFQNGTGNADQLPMDVPVGPDYVLGPGDGLSIDIWGSASGHLQRVVDRQGVISLPEAGIVQVPGRASPRYSS